MSRAPYSTKKPNKPEYVESPTVGVTDVTVDIPTQTRVTPSGGGIVQEEKELPISHLEEEHTFTQLLASRRSLKPETPTIHGSKAPPSPKTPEKVIGEPTSAKVTDRREVTIGQWANVSLTTNIDTVVDNRPRATGFKLLPKDKNTDVEYTEEA